jgi:hypothetical protein
MELIVAGYVKMKDRRALSDLLTQRNKSLAELHAASGGIDPANAIRAIQAELPIIEAGLEELGPTLSPDDESQR